MTQTNLKKYNNDWYKPGKGVIIRSLWFLVNALFFVNALNPSSFIKVFLLRLFGAKIGKGVVIKPSVNIKYPWRLTIGNYSWIGEKAWIDNLGDVTIGDNCCISQGALLLCGNHDFGKTTFDLMVKPITLENGVWVGAQSIVCPGVTCAEHSVLAINSVATKTLDAFSIYQGNPAVKVKTRTIK